MKRQHAPTAVAQSFAAARPVDSWRPIDLVLLLILTAALACRLHLATTAEYIHDEENTAIPIARTISFEPGALHLPLRGENHGALPAYVVKASGALFGTTPLGYRSLHVAAGLVVILFVWAIARQWYGPVPALWAAALFGFNEYYLAISSRATAHVPHLFLVAAAVFAFSRFLAVHRAAYLYLAGLSLGLAFYCKEHSALLLLVFFATLLRRAHRRWLLSRHVYLACALYALIISPDVAWNLRTDPSKARVTYNNQTLGQATYSAHLKRIGGLGFSPYPSMFYARKPVMDLHLRLTGKELRDETPEYRSLNPVLGVLLLGSVLLMTLRPAGPAEIRAFLLIFAWGVFGFFTLVKKGDPPYRLDPVSWIWVESTIVPTTILAGARLGHARGLGRIAAWTIAAGALAYGVHGLVGTP